VRLFAWSEFSSNPRRLFITLKPQHNLYDKPIILSSSLFTQITQVLQIDQWGRLYFYKLSNPLVIELVFEEATYHDDPSISDHMRTCLDSQRGSAALLIVCASNCTEYSREIHEISCSSIKFTLSKFTLSEARCKKQRHGR
jgi:hypothetical protein